MSPRTIDTVRDQLVTHFFQANPNRLVNGIAIGSVPEGDQTPPPPVERVDSRLLVFVDTSAAQCEQDAIEAQAREIAREPGGQPAHPCQILRTSRFVALQTPQDISVSPYAPFRCNVPPVSAGTLGARVKVDRISRDYILGSCHVLAFNGRVPQQTPILTPGLLDDPTGGSNTGSRSYFVPLAEQAWPLSSMPANAVDCALAEELRGSHPVASLRALAPVSSVPLGTPVIKTGRATGKTDSMVWILGWAGPIDFSFGTRYFQGLLGTRDGHKVFASPGDSGSVITDVAQNNGLGLVVARGYGFDTLNNFTTYFILICPLPAVAQGLADVMNQDLRPNPPLTGGDLKFYVDL